MIYGALLLLYLLGIAPKLLFDRIAKGKKHPGLLQRLGVSIPNALGKETIWLHAVSVGEVKAAAPIFRSLREQYPGSFFLVTTTTATGQEEAKRTLGQADAFAYLPIDFAWIVKRWVKKLRPHLFVVVESDFWPNLISALKNGGARVVLVSGKLSKRSARRFLFFSRFAKRFFSRFDLLCLQNEEHKNRFLPLVKDSSRLHVTGNLKLDIEPQIVDVAHWKRRLSLPGPVLTISCTHAPEEEQILDALEGMQASYFLAPRHPERFEEVARLLKRRNIPFTRWSELSSDPKRVILVDAMGQLPICYSLSRLAILGGSFISTVGGHNVLEPCLYGTPVFFGPHMFSQTEFAARVLEAKAGRQMALEQLKASLDSFLSDPKQEQKMRAAAFELIRNSRGAASRTLNKLRE